MMRFVQSGVRAAVRNTGTRGLTAALTAIGVQNCTDQFDQEFEEENEDGFIFVGAKGRQFEKEINHPSQTSQCIHEKIDVVNLVTFADVNEEEESIVERHRHKKGSRSLKRRVSSRRVVEGDDDTDDDLESERPHAILLSAAVKADPRLLLGDPIFQRVFERKELLSRKYRVELEKLYSRLLSLQKRGKHVPLEISRRFERLIPLWSDVIDLTDLHSLPDEGVEAFKSIGVHLESRLKELEDCKNRILKCMDAECFESARLIAKNAEGKCKRMNDAIHLRMQDVNKAQRKHLFRRNTALLALGAGGTLILGLRWNYLGFIPQSLFTGTAKSLIAQAAAVGFVVCLPTVVVSFLCSLRCEKFLTQLRGFRSSIVERKDIFLSLLERIEEEEMMGMEIEKLDVGGKENEWDDIYAETDGEDEETDATEHEGDVFESESESEQHDCLDEHESNDHDSYEDSDWDIISHGNQ
eukprot:m.67154 g.67154  ORF g.67154 m.67154 type:complete len:468 (+) comp8207_c0_seq1:252-1655(+)